jgi:uncharacterized membrane protein YeiH
MPEQIIQFLQALWTVLQGLSQNTLDDKSVELLQLLVQWSAIFLSALSGMYAARKRGMDYFGALVIAFVVCVGGGTIRDMLLGRFPIFWISTPIYFVTVVVVSLFGLFIERGSEKGEKIAGKIARPVAKIAKEQSTLYIVIDALALGLWAYLGTNFALVDNVSPVIAPVLGVITAVFGGVLRDVFFARIPQQFMPGQYYAVAAAAGSIAYAILWSFGPSRPLSFLACIAVTFVIRIVSVKFNLVSSGGS